MLVEGTKDKGAVARELTRQELREFRKLLLAKKKEMLGDLTGMRAEARGAGPGEQSGDPPVEQTKYADESDDREITIDLLASERVLLQEINEALARIDEGTFGVCLATGQPIGKNRLLARPWAKYCIAHARSMEKKQTISGGYSRRVFVQENFDDSNNQGREPSDLRSIANDEGESD